MPQEFDLLLDEEVGFGVPPLLAHVRECEQCTAELAAARAALAELERVPHLAPSPLFAERVMRRVQVFRPWHAAALDLARRLVPSPGPLRTLVGTAAAVAMVTLTLAALWVATRLDSFLALAGIVVEGVRLAALDVVGALFGSAALAAVEAGGTQTLVMAGVAVLLSAILGIAAIAAAARAVRARR